MSLKAHHEKRHPLDVFFQLYLPSASYIATQLYSALPSDIVLRTVKGKYNITETKGFNITFDLSKISLQRSWNITKNTCIYYVLESQMKDHPKGWFFIW